jgi:hypothetical protein
VGDLLITEFMANPSAVSDANGEWFEVYNNSGVTVGIGDLILADNAGSHTVNSTATIAADSYAVFCNNSDSGTNGGVTCDYEYGSDLNLGDGGDVITLEYGGVTFDEVDYGSAVSAWSISSGYSLSLAHGELIFDDSDNDTEDYWCDSSTSMSGGDYGTPGTANDDECGTRVSHGITSAGSTYSCCAPNYLVAHQITITGDGVFADFNPHSLYLGYNDVALGLYEDSGGSPGALVAGVSSVSEGNLAGGTSLTATWWTVEPDDGPVWVSAGTYWLAYSGNFAGAAAGHFMTHSTSNTSTNHYNSHSPGSALPDPFGSLGTYSAYEIDLYADVIEY